MRKPAVMMVADLVETDGKTPRQVMLDAVNLSLENGLSAVETVAVISELERRLGVPIHPVQFDD